MKGINTIEEFQEVIQGENIIIKFSTEWCKPCHMMTPVLEEVEKISNVEVYVVDLTEDITLGKSYDVLSVPTLSFFSKGSEYRRLIGLQPKENILNALQLQRFI